MTDQTKVILPAPLSEMQDNGLLRFCTKVAEDLQYWPSWINQDFSKEKIRSVADAVEKLKDESSTNLDHRGDRATTRLSIGPNQFELDWRGSRTCVYPREHKAWIFDVYALVVVRWKGREVLSLRMGGDESYGAAVWQIVAVTKYEPAGDWLTVVARINDTSTNT
jgi:hypothetical protein